MHVPPYISNGVIGGSFDHMGFQSHPNHGYPNGRTVLGYIGHYYMHRASTRQAQLPLSYISAKFADGSTLYNMMDINSYKQELDIYHGILETEYDLFGRTKITAFAHQSLVGLFVLKIERKSDSPEKDIVLTFNCETSGTQNNLKHAPDKSDVDILLSGETVEITSSTNMVETKWNISADAAISTDEDLVTIRLTNRETVIRVWVGREDYDLSLAETQTFDELLDSHKKSWEKSWSKSWVNLPEERGQHIWTRANYYNLSNFPIVTEKALIPTGMNSNIWGFTFPQDVYYVAENLLRSGHFERYKMAMKYWLDILPEVKKYSERIMDVEGGFYPWTPPFGMWDEFEKDGVVGNDSYEIHNPAYVSAMVWHYYLRTGDEDFLREYFPIMEEVWRFYSNVTHKNDLGTYDVNHHKAAGQDEASKLPSSKNLLCASYSAEYSARNYIAASKIIKRYDKELFHLAGNIVDKGYERSLLLNDRGYYVTYEGDKRPPNSQKHPVQLNAIVFTPMPDLGVAEPAVKAHELRYDLTSEAKKPVSHGWTYAAFALSSSRLGLGEDFARDMTAAQYCAHADPRWIQFYEFTFWERWTLSTAYYFPTQGLYQQAYTDALVQDWQGYIEVFAALMPHWKNKTFSFKGITSLNGVSVDGSWENGKIRLLLHSNGAKHIDLKVSSVSGNISVKGDANDMGAFRAGEIVRLEFEADRTIEIIN
jgi:hypothetical protein